MQEGLIKANVSLKYDVHFFKKTEGVSLLRGEWLMDLMGGPANILQTLS